MRMRMIDPALLCGKHLKGEHYEIHLHRHNFVKRHSIAGRVAPVAQIEPEAMQARHDALAAEMTRRGMKHTSPYAQPDLSYLPEAHRTAKVDARVSRADLYSRCPECRENLIAGFGE